MTFNGIVRVHLSIIIPAYNEEKLLPHTLVVVANGRETLETVGVISELIVCDNNSQDATARLAAEAGARVIAEPVNQIGRARNTGASIATGDWLLFLDADSAPSEELWRDLAATLLDPTVIAGGTTLRPHQNYRMLTFFMHCWNAWSRLSGEAAGAFIFCRRAAFLEVGGFDVKMFAAEEIVFSRALKKLGKSRGQRMRILHQHPLLTSARKAELYTPGEMLSFIGRTILRRGKTLNSRENCPIWYDGRR